ncbi:MAG: hypothetical protein M1151_04180 [Candidatus Thermoplasmatota archaeon]|nr:hypothetical protein [Candidatus Thermoplasmatota archaeon]MCL5785853.1 hypothetical protein [Candidatus Thermoplasmatota archaeon]
MKGSEGFRGRLLRLISENPGLHFRELQRRMETAVGQLEYHLYQLDRDGKISIKKDGRNVRYFSNESGTISDRRIAFYMRNRFSRDLIVKSLSAGGEFVKVQNSGKVISLVNQMADEGVIEIQVRNSQTFVSLTERDVVMAFLRKYRNSFLDSLASAILGLIDEP